MTLRPVARSLVLGALLMFVPIARAGWTSNVTGTIVNVQVQAGNGWEPVVVFSLTNQPKTSCTRSNAFGYAASDVPNKELRDRWISQLLAAKAAGRQVTIGYDGSTTGTCSTYGYPLVFQVTVL